MGYDTTFNGALQLSRQLSDVEKNYINLMSSTRRMQRDVNKLMELYKGEGGYPFATEQTPEAIYGFLGEFFVGAKGFKGQDDDESVIDHNTPSGEIGWGNKLSDEILAQQVNEKLKRPLQPGLWCQWIINDDNELVWDEVEKFYNYTEWLEYLVKTFFEPWGVKLNGQIYWYGESSGDLGKIIVTDNVIEVKEGYIEYR